MYIKQLQFFGFLPQQRFYTLILCTIINLVCLPVDYSPFYDTNNLQNQFVDIKFQQISTQPSITIVKGGQIIDSLVMMLIVNIFNFIPQNNIYFQKYYSFIVSCLIVNICLQSYHIVNRYLSFKNDTHTYFYENIVSLDKLQNILKNSQKARYLFIDIVDQFQNLSNNQQQRENIFEAFMNIHDYDKQLIQINNGLLCKYQTKYQVDSKYFIDEILNYIQNQPQIRRVEIKNLSDNQIILVKQALVERVFKFGINENLRSIFIFLGLYNNNQFTNQISNFESEILKLISFQRTISLYFSTNPKFIYYDLYETDLP
ncbi:hypothetical protein ABPG72_005067 [Tetrahymena utriculariae]